MGNCLGVKEDMTYRLRILVSTFTAALQPPLARKLCNTNTVTRNNESRVSWASTSLDQMGIQDTPRSFQAVEARRGGVLIAPTLIPSIAALALLQLPVKTQVISAF